MEKRTMKNTILTVLLICLILTMTGLMAGCSGSPGMTKEDIHRRHVRYAHTNWIMFQDDIDAILMIDQPSRLSQMYSR